MSLAGYVSKSDRAARFLRSKAPGVQSTGIAATMRAMPSSPAMIFMLPPSVARFPVWQQ